MSSSDVLHSWLSSVNRYSLPLSLSLCCFFVRALHTLSRSIQQSTVVRRTSCTWKYRVNTRVGANQSSMSGKCRLVLLLLVAVSAISVSPAIAASYKATVAEKLDLCERWVFLWLLWSVLLFRLILSYFRAVGIFAWRRVFILHYLFSMRR